MQQTSDRSRRKKGIWTWPKNRPRKREWRRRKRRRARKQGQHTHRSIILCWQILSVHHTVPVKLDTLWFSSFRCSNKRNNVKRAGPKNPDPPPSTSASGYLLLSHFPPTSWSSLTSQLFITAAGGGRLVKVIDWPTGGTWWGRGYRSTEANQCQAKNQTTGWTLLQKKKKKNLRKSERNLCAPANKHLREKKSLTIGSDPFVTSFRLSETTHCHVGC